MCDESYFYYKNEKNDKRYNEEKNGKNRRRGWRVLDVTASEGLPELICRRLERSSDTEYELEVDLMVVKATARPGDKGGEADGVYEALGRVAGALTKRGKGLLVTIDEIQDASMREVREIAVAIQHLIREKQNIAFIFAGLTSGVMDLLSEDGPTFLRRAYPEELGTIPTDEVAAALRSTIEKNGMSIDDAGLAAAADATAGYAYLIQLVGYNIWRCAQMRREGDKGSIFAEDVERGIRAARNDFDRCALETAIGHLPKTAMEYLLAMTEDAVASSTGKIAARLGSGRLRSRLRVGFWCLVRSSSPRRADMWLSRFRLRASTSSKIAPDCWRGTG